MAFMVPEYHKGMFYAVETDMGHTDLVPGDLVPKKPKRSDFHPYVEGTPEEFEAVHGWFARLSAPGYMDATDWSGPFKTKKKAEEHIEDTYEVDPETGEHLEYNPPRKSRKKAKKTRKSKRKRNPVSMREIMRNALK